MNRIHYKIDRRLIEGALGSANWYIAIPAEGERVFLGTSKDDASWKIRRMRRDGHTFSDPFRLFSGDRYRGLFTEVQ
jgi:hypothetical protein